MLSRRVYGLLSCLITLSLVLVLGACNPALPRAVEAIRVIHQIEVGGQSVETPTAPASPLSIPLGVIRGNLCYGSERLPPMTVYARNERTQVTYSLHVAGTYEYEIQVPAEGRYLVFAWSDAGAFTPHSLGGHYSCAGDFMGQMTYLGKGNLHLKCADAEKDDSTPLSVTVRPGEITPGIHICDWGDQELVPTP